MKVKNSSPLTFFYFGMPHFMFYNLLSFSSNFLPCLILLFSKMFSSFMRFSVYFHPWLTIWNILGQGIQLKTKFTPIKSCTHWLFQTFPSIFLKNVVMALQGHLQSLVQYLHRDFILFFLQLILFQGLFLYKGTFTSKMFNQVNFIHLYDYFTLRQILFVVLICFFHDVCTKNLTTDNGFWNPDAKQTLHQFMLLPLVHLLVQLSVPALLQLSNSLTNIATPAYLSASQ